MEKSSVCRHKMCSFGLVCMFHKIWDINKNLRSVPIYAAASHFIPL